VSGVRTSPGDVVDGHVHLFTRPLLEEWLAKTPDPPERMKEAVKTGKWGRRGRQAQLHDHDPRQAAEWYAQRLDENGVAKAVIMSVVPDSQYMRDFAAAGEGRVYALANVDPRLPDAPEMLDREMAAGFKGVKLLPVNRCYHLSDPACRPFFERANELGAPITVHYGVTVDPRGDLRYADPIDLSPVARDFPDVTFVVAHFGAGYLDQVLRVAYQCGNVCVDSSGTNNWMDYQVHFCSLQHVFERAVGALGPERVMFGTDANSTNPYRAWIKYQQLRILEEMGLADRDRDLIARANAVRIFGLED
jgi:predicted TIM-barrel fold metal-dependent hydrolase